MTGTGFTTRFWQSMRSPDPGAYGVALEAGLTRDGKTTYGHGVVCEVIASAAPYRIRIDAEGNLTGSFVVPDSGGCFQQDRRIELLPSGRYEVIVGCHTCDVGTFIIRAA